MKFIENDSKDPKDGFTEKSDTTTVSMSTEKTEGNNRKEIRNPKEDISYIIVTAMLSIAVCFLALIAYAIYRLLPLPPDVTGGIATTVVLVLVIIIYWQRRNVLGLIKRLNQRWTSHKTDRRK